MGLLTAILPPPAAAAPAEAEAPPPVSIALWLADRRRAFSATAAASSPSSAANASGRGRTPSMRRANAAASSASAKSRPSVQPSSSMACSLGVRGTCLQGREECDESSVTGSHYWLSRCAASVSMRLSHNARAVLGAALKETSERSPQFEWQLSGNSRRSANRVGADIEREDADAGRLRGAINYHGSQPEATRRQLLP